MEVTLQVTSAWMGIIKTQIEIQMSSFWELLCKWMDGQAGLNALMWISISFNLKCPLDFLWKAESYQSHYFIQASNSSFAFKKKMKKANKKISAQISGKVKTQNKYIYD